MIRCQIEERIASFHQIAPGAICDMIRFSVSDLGEDWVTLECGTAEWMRNTMGFLHGGMGATILDQAMSLVAHCVKRGEGPTPAIDMQISFHRPVMPGKNVQVCVETLSVTNSLIRLNSRLMQNGKLCMSAGGTYFQKQK